MDKRLEVAIAAARAGGEVALKYFNSANLKVETKEDSSPVTIADRETEARIVEVLRAAFPDHGFLGEEHGEQGGSGPRWIIDPIDGTKSFIRGIPYFASLIALEEDGEITTGVIYAPAVDDLLWAQRGQGAHDRNGPLRVSKVASLADSMLLFGGPGFFKRHGYWSAFEQLVDASSRQRGYGDYFGYTFVARGQAEAVLELDLKPWDMAAIAIVIEEAGGRFTNFSGERTIYDGSALASNGVIHEQVLSVLRGKDSNR